MITRRHVLLDISSAVALAAPELAHAIHIFGSIRSTLGPSTPELASNSDIPFEGAKFKLVGVGGAGFNFVEHMIACGCAGIEFIHADTDGQALSRSTAHSTVRLGQPELCLGSKGELTCEVKQAEEQAIRIAIDGVHMLFIAAGLGGIAGTFAAPVIARIAKEMGILTVGIAMMPFAYEGESRTEMAKAGLAWFESNADSVIVVQNEKLLETLGHETTQDDIFAYANYLSTNVVGGVVEIIRRQGHVSVDFEEVRMVMSATGGISLAGTAVASGSGRARIAAQRALESPLFQGPDMSCAGGFLVLLSGAKRSLRLSESSLIMKAIRAHASHDACLIYGTFDDDSLGEQIRVTVIVTGVKLGGGLENRWTFSEKSGDFL